MAYNCKSLFVILAVLICGPRMAVAEDPARPASKPPCAPQEKCVDAGKPAPDSTTTATPSSPEPQADKRGKKKKAVKATATEKRVSPKKTARKKREQSNNTVQSTGKESTPAPVANPPSQLQNAAEPECPGSGATPTSGPCAGQPEPNRANAAASQAAQVKMTTESAETGSDLLLQSADATTKGATPDTDTELLSKDELFGLPDIAGAEKDASRHVEWRGFVQNESAYTYDDPAHWSRGVIRTQVGAQGNEDFLKWKATIRLDVDPVYYGSDFYPQPVRKDQRLDFLLRETYVDTSAGGLDWRIGKQNIVWGEMVGLFFADVVSARDQRDFILPDFEIIRIPQWAARAEYFGEKSHVEVIWLPYPEIDDIGKPGAEFFPFQIPPPAGFNQQFNAEQEPENNLKNSNYGARLSTLRHGWDLSTFYYRSTDVSPSFYRDIDLSATTPTLVYTPRHDRIWQAGGTLAKDFGSVVLKGETIYASGRKFNVTRLSEPTGVVPQDTLDYVLGLDFVLPGQTRLNLQYFERLFFHHDPDLLQDSRESGISVLLSGKIGTNFEPQFLFIQSLNRNDSLMRPMLAWIPEKNWRVTFGVDIFTGPVTGFFGRFQDRDRAYVALRYDF
jgi:hypothetical protein